MNEDVGDFLPKWSAEQGFEECENSENQLEWNDCIDIYCSGDKFCIRVNNLSAPEFKEEEPVIPLVVKIDSLSSQGVLRMTFNRPLVEGDAHAD